MLRFGLFAGRLSHEIALFHCLRAILRFSLELHFYRDVFFLANCLSQQWVPFYYFERYKNHLNMYLSYLMLLNRR